MSKFYKMHIVLLHERVQLEVWHFIPCESEGALKIQSLITLAYMLHCYTQHFTFSKKK